MAAAQSAQTRRPRGRRRAVGVTLAVFIPLLLVGAAYVAGYLMTGDRTPANAAVEGVAIGGMTRAEAESKLINELSPLVDRDLALSVDGKESVIKPSEWGMTLDAKASVDRSGVGKSFDPRQIVQVLTGGQNHPAVVSFDQSTLSSKVASLAKETDRPAKDASISLDQGELKVTKAEAAKKLKQPEAAQAIEQAYFNRTSAELPLAITEPAITDDAVDAAAAEAKVALSGPVKLTVAGSDRSYEVPAKSIAEAYGFEQVDGQYRPKLDSEKLWKANAEAVAKLATQKPRDARVQLQGGKPVVIPAVDGVAVSKESFLAAVTPAISSPDKRSVEVQATTAKAKHTTADAEKAGVREIVSTFTSEFPYAEYRNINLSVAARLMNNTYLPPNGGQFSLNGAIGERTRAKGFVDGAYIDNGILRQGLAGGISQSATTVYNAAFFSGARIDQHQPHTLYFSRYPAGRESTVFLPTIDVKFTNETPYGMVVEAFVNKAPPGGRGSITVRIWSTKYYTIETAEPTRSNYTSGQTRYVSYPGCQGQAPIAGFTASYYRITRKLDGSLARPRENFTWRYTPGDQIICR